MNVLVIAAHPDDEVLGCGGTIARLAREGNDVCIGILGEGLTSRGEPGAPRDEKALESLREQSRRAADLLGAKEVVFHNLPDNRFDTVPMLDVVKRIESWIERFEPRVLYTNHGGDLNVDHQITFRATLTATRPMANAAVKELYAYEVLSSTEWAFAKLDPGFRPNVFSNIAGTLGTKLRALESYQGELRPFPHPRSPEAVRAAAQRWGSVAGLPAAEAFELIRAIR